MRSIRTIGVSFLGLAALGGCVTPTESSTPGPGGGKADGIVAYQHAVARCPFGPTGGHEQGGLLQLDIDLGAGTATATCPESGDPCILDTDQETLRIVAVKRRNDAMDAYFSTDGGNVNKLFLDGWNGDDTGLSVGMSITGVAQAVMMISIDGDEFVNASPVTSCSWTLH